MQIQTQLAHKKPKSSSNFHELSTLVNARIHHWINSGHQLFQTDVDGQKLWDTYLQSFNDEAFRQTQNCACCRAFMKRFGNLVVIDDKGSIASALWAIDQVPERYQLAVQNVLDLVLTGKIIQPLISSKKMLGFQEKGGWNHFYIDFPNEYLYIERVLNAGQAIAEKREDYKNVSRALAEFNADVVKKALTLLDQEALYRSEKVKAPVAWLANLHSLTAFAREERRNNIIWKAVASAPSGFCHPRSSMAGTLLEDLAAGMAFNEVAKRFAAKMHPLLYQRPQAAPTEGNIKRGEEIIAKLGLEKSLERRFARLDEIQSIWKPIKHDTKAGKGIFAHIMPKHNKENINLHADSKRITFDKFMRTVLPETSFLEVYVAAKESFFAMLTAAHADAPPILQWDNTKQRNPFSWYTYHGGSLASKWGLNGERYYPVSAITLSPSKWFGEAYTHQGSGALFVIEGCLDKRENAGNALFPESLIHELREVRATIEAYSKSAKIFGRESASVCGIGYYDQSLKVRATINGQTFDYLIDRWD